MFRCLNLLLLLCLIHYIESSPRCVTGEQGGCITLLCDFKHREISDIALSRFSKIIPIYPNEEHGRIFKNGSCDVIIKDLRFSDAGRYILRVYYYDDQTEVQRLTLEYQLDIHEKPHRDEEHHKSVIIVVCVIGALVLVLVIPAVIWKHKRQPRKAESVQEEKSTQENLETTLVDCNRSSDPTDLEDCQHELMNIRAGCSS